jgi:hypothetical protein
MKVKKWVLPSILGMVFMLVLTLTLPQPIFAQLMCEDPVCGTGGSWIMDCWNQNCNSPNPGSLCRVCIIDP